MTVESIVITKEGGESWAGAGVRNIATIHSIHISVVPIIISRSKYLDSRYDLRMIVILLK